MFRYELHCHTGEVSLCAGPLAGDVANFYAKKGYAGIFITDHFVCAPGEVDEVAWKIRVEKFCEGYQKAKDAGDAAGLAVFFAFEYTHAAHPGADFLIYGLDEKWLLGHPEIVEKKYTLKKCLDYFAQNGAFIVQAHPFRESSYIEMIRLLPRGVHGVEVINANRGDVENAAADRYARFYNLHRLAGTDNHKGKGQSRLCGIDTEKAILCPRDLHEIVKTGKYYIFDEKNL